MATLTDEGFVKLQFNGTWLGQAVQNTFWYGFGVGFAPAGYSDASTLADEIRDEIVGNTDTRPGYAAYRKVFPATYSITGCDVWVKGAAGVELAVAPSYVSILGSRVTAGDALPPNLTASAYAAAERYGQRGSRIGIAGGTEADQVSGYWVATADYFKDLCQDMCNVFYQSGLWLTESSATQLIPAVVPRVRAGSPGEYTYRLPIEAGDVPATVSIAPWSVGDYLGTANSRKPPIR